MAQKRMFNMKIVDSDAFLDMPLSTQCLYFHLNMRADDDGFVGNPKRIARLISANDDDLKLLLTKRFILAFDSGVIVIKHWRIHNTLSSKSYTETAYTDEKRSLLLKKNKSYSLTEGAPIDDSSLISTQAKKEMQEKCKENAFLMHPDKIREEESRLEEKSEVIQHYPSQPTLPESDSSISDEIDCRTKNVRRKDVQQVIDAWNGTGLKQIERITPESKRGDMTRKRIRDYGLDKVLKAIENVKDSKFLCGENKKGWTATYDWFIRPENFQRVLEGNYDHQFQKEGIKTNNPFLKILEEEYEQD